MKYVYVKEQFEFNGKKYPIGHRFRIIGDSYRGWDLEDDSGNQIYECLFIHHKFQSLDDFRSDRLGLLEI